MHKMQLFCWMFTLSIIPLTVQNGRTTLICAFVPSLSNHEYVLITSSSCRPKRRSNSRNENRNCNYATTYRSYTSLLSTTTKQSIAIIGGGISGLACAQKLSKEFNVTVYDTGRLRPGGRCSSRLINDIPPPSDTAATSLSSTSSTRVTTTRINGDHKSDDSNSSTTQKMWYHHEQQQQRSNGLLSKYIYDHAAQVVSCPNHPRFKAFRQQLKEWETNGILRVFPNNTLYNILSYKKIEPINHIKFYYGTIHGGGIGGLATSIVNDCNDQIQIKQNIWVPPRNGIQYMINQNKWKVVDNTNIYQRPPLYDHVIIAHNGKCAYQIAKNIPVPEILNLMKVQFQYQIPACGGPCMTLNSIYSLTFAIPSKNSILSQYLPKSFLSGYVKNHPALRFISCQSRKYNNGTDDTSIEVWTVLSSGTFATKYKASPQEKLPNKVVQKVIRLLLIAVEEALTGNMFTVRTASRYKDDNNKNDMSSTKEKRQQYQDFKPSTLELSLLDRHLQLWGAGVPLNVYEIERGRTPTGFLYNNKYNVGVCGDWLVEASIAGAWTSGRLLADHMLLKDGMKSHGLKKGSFRRSVATAKAGIGMLQI